MFKYLKRFFVILVLSILFIPSTKAYHLFLDVNVWGFCTIVKICRGNNHHIIWEKHFLTPELLNSAKKEEVPKVIAYLKTITYKRIKSNSAKLKIRKYMRALNKNKNKFSESDVIKLNNLIFLTALKNI